MIRMFQSLCLALLLGGVLQAAPLPPGKPLTLLVSIDGFRADYLARGQSPTLAALAREGALAKGLVPLFPTYTFPNHVSLVTGRRPAQHGILNNTMWDPSIPDQVFRLRDRTAVTNPVWWRESEPIWVTAAKQGLISSTLFWPGTEVSIQGVQPRDWLPYQHEMTSQERVDRLLGWLTDIRPDRPQADFATLYFSDVDSAGHASGPDSAAVNAAIASVDRALARLIDGLKAAGLWQRTTLVVVSDHGMSHVPTDQIIQGQALIKAFPSARWQWTGATSGLSLGGESADAVLAALAQAPQLQCWPKARVPTRFGGMDHRRVPDVVCLAAPGWAVSDRMLSFPIPGQHGFDPDHPEMHGLFIAHGTRIRPKPLAEVSSLEVYPLLAALLGIRPAPHDGEGWLARALIE